MSTVRFIGLAAGLLCASGIIANRSAAGTSEPVPNFSSVDLPWVATGRDYLPPQSGLGPITYDRAHPVTRQQANNDGKAENRLLQLANLNNSNLKPWVIDFLRKANEDLLAGKQRYAARASCMPGGVPQFLLYAGGFRFIYFIQTPTEVLMIHQADSQVRRVYLNVPHSVHPQPSWYGESVGHYEGDTLVVDTVGLNDRTFVDDHYNVPHTSQLHVVERYRLLQDGTLQANFTVDDPGAFNAPWSGSVRYRSDDSRETLTEEPCAENNFHLPAYIHPPTAAKSDF